MSEVLRHATDRSLVIIDEFGRGTSSTEGQAIAFAVAQELVHRHCITFFSTHLHESLRSFVRENAEFVCSKRMKTAQVTDNELVYLFEIEDGTSNTSHG